MISRLKNWMKWLLKPLIKDHVYTIKQGIARGYQSKGELGLIPSSHQTREERFLRGLDLTGKVVYDIGAYDGAFSMFFAGAVGPEGDVIAWEPNPENVRQIEDHLQLNDLSNVRLVPHGVSSQNETRTLRYPERDPGWGTIMENGQQRDFNGEYEVSVWPLDEAVNQFDLPRPDFIKVDVEGAEVQVARGGRELLNFVRPDLFVELHETDETRKAEMFEEIKKQLPDVYGHRVIDENSRGDPGQVYFTPQ